MAGIDRQKTVSTQLLALLSARCTIVVIVMEGLDSQSPPDTLAAITEGKGVNRL
jgi:hypothetical protein